MPDFGPRWKIESAIPVGRGGQCRAYLVRDAQGEPGKLFVAKILEGADDPGRRRRLENEIEVCKTFAHPNVVRFVDSGKTTNSRYPYMVTPYYENRSLADYWTKHETDSPVEILTFFAKICDGVAYVNDKGVVHRDLKPANIFIDENHQPVVGDFGICFREGGPRLTETMEVAAARWFGAPELRNGRVDNPTAAADVYSLGKLLYYLFTGDVYDREEVDYGGERSLARRLGESVPAHSFVDDLISASVRYNPSDRQLSAKTFVKAARDTIDRIEAGGHVLDLRLPQRCLFCAVGNYRVLEMPPDVEQRSSPTAGDVYLNMRNLTVNAMGSVMAGRGPGWPVPFYLICDHCGNVQRFQIDNLAPKATKNWKP